MKNKMLCSILIIIILIIMGLLINLFFIKNNDEKEEKSLEKIKVAEVTHSIFYTPFYVAIENGYFEEYGIDIDLTLVSGSDSVAASVLANDTNIGLAGPESAIFVYEKGEKNYLQVFCGLTKKDGQFLIGRGSTFDWNDLIGKEILVGRSTGMPALSFLKALENKGIDKSKVNINYSIEFSSLMGAFIGGDGDYVNLFEPLATNIQKNKNGYVLESVGDASDEFPYTAFYARKDYLNNNKQLLINFTKAINEGLKYTKNNSSSDIAKIISKQFTDTNIDDLETMIERYKEADVWMENSYIKEDFFNKITNLLKENNIIDSDIPYKDLVINLYE